MKRLLLMLFYTGSFAYPQTTPLSSAVEPQFDFAARLKLYVKKTYADPWRHFWMIQGVATDDYLFRGIKKWDNFGESLAPVYGRRVINNTLEFAADAAVFHGDARYRVSTSTGLINRGLYAAASTFTAHDANGKIRPAYSRIFAVTASLLIATQWQPHPLTGRNLACALVLNVTDMAQDNLLQEFTPDMKRFGRELWHKVHRITTHP